MCLHLSFNLPDDLEQRLRREVADLDASAKESFLLDLFRRGVLSHYDLSRALGIDRFETDAWLKRKNVYEWSLTTEDLEEDRKTAEHLMRLRNRT